MITGGRSRVPAKWRIVAHACCIATLRTLAVGCCWSGLLWLVISPSTGVLLLAVGNLMRRQTRAWRQPRSAAVQPLFYP